MSGDQPPPLDEDWLAIHAKEAAAVARKIRSNLADSKVNVGGLGLSSLRSEAQLGAELLNFGALLALMGVNVASLSQAWKEGRFRLWVPILLGVCGFITCFMIWLNLGCLAWIVGSAWAATGVALWAVRRKQIQLPA